MSFKIEYKIDGRRMSQDQWFREIERKTMSAVRDEARRVAASTRCPTHGQTARVVEKPFGSEFQIEGCCEALVQSVMRRLK